MTHEVVLQGYNVKPGSLQLGTFDSYGIEEIHVTADDEWAGLGILAVFHAPNGTAKKVVVGADGMLAVPPEATAKQAGVGRIVFVGLTENVQRITVDMGYNIKPHSDIEGDNPGTPTPDVVQQILENSNHAVSIATAAQEAAENARQAAEDAAKKAGEGAGGAAASAAAAKKSAEDAAASSKSAASKAEESESSANAANESAKAAQTAQGSAENAAQIAADAADVARQAAGEAGSAAKASSTSAGEAAQSAKAAETAKQRAEDAAKKALEAKTGSENALQDADAAKNAAIGYADAAAEKATAASKSENSAADSAAAAKKSSEDADNTANNIKDSMAQISENKEAVSKLKEEKADKIDLDTERKRIDVLNDGGLNLKDEVIDTSIKAWLTEHPEATTTVQDGAITETKIAAEFFPYISNSYITPQMFGAKGDGVSDDTESIASCFAYARSKKSVIVFPAGNYGISEPLSVNFDIKIIGENAFIIPLKEMTHFMSIKTYEKTNSGYISGLGFSAGNAFSVSTGVKISYVANFRLHGLKIFNTTVGIDYIAGYELLVDSCLIRTSIPSTESIGIDVKTSDSNFSNNIIVNYHIGVWDRYGGNFYDKIHAWIANSDIVKGSIYFFANGSAYLSQCFNDTYETAIYINGKQNVIVSELRNFYNSNYINSDVIDDVPVLFYVSNGEINQNLRCFGVSAQDVGSLFNGKRIKFSNVEKEKWGIDYKSLCPDSLSVYCDGVPDGLIVYNPGVTVATSSEASLWDIKYNRIYRRGRHCKLEFAALYRGTATNLNNVFVFTNKATHPANAKELVASLSKTQYDIPDAFAYLYIGGGSLSLKLPDSESKFVHFDVDYCAN